MKRKIVLNPDYQYLEEFIKKLPNIFEQEGNTIQNRRNVIKVFEYEGISLNIKRFRKPIFVNRIVYSFFRKPKAYRAYYNALRVIEKGFETPIPIAYIEEKNSGLISFSYFISIHLKDTKEIREYYHSKVVGDETLLTAFAKYSAQLHNAGILHKDYSPGNILISENTEGFNFSLIDINRMNFCDVNLETGCKNFERLFEYDVTFSFIAEKYAKYRNLPIDTCVEQILKYKHQFEHKKARKQKLKAFFGKKK